MIVMIEVFRFGERDLGGGMGEVVSYDGKVVGVGICDGGKARVCADTLLGLFNMVFVAVYLLGFGAQVHHDWL